MLFHFVCYFSRYCLLWLLSLWPSLDLSPSWGTQGPSSNLLSPSSTHTLAQSQPSLGSLTIPFTATTPKYISLQSLPRTSCCPHDVSTWIHNSVIAYLNQSSSLSPLLSRPLTRTSQSLPQVSVNGDSVFPVTSDRKLWNPPGSLSLSQPMFSLSAEQVKSTDEIRLWSALPMLSCSHCHFWYWLDWERPDSSPPASFLPLSYLHRARVTFLKHKWDHFPCLLRALLWHSP